MRKRRVAQFALEDLVKDLGTLADQLQGELDREWWARLGDDFRRIEALAKGGPELVRRAQAARDAAYLKRISKGSRRGRRKSTATGTVRAIVPIAANHPAT